MEKTTSFVIGCLAMLYTVSAEAGFVQPVTVSWTGTSTINSPSALVGDVASETDSHPDPVSGGGGTSWYALNWSGHSLVFSFSAAYALESFHLWDYYRHTNEVLKLTLYDSIGGAGNVLYDVTHTIVPGPSGGGSKRHDLAFPSVIVGAQSGRLTPISESSDGFPGFGLAEIGFVAAVPEASALVLPGMTLATLIASALRRRSSTKL